MGVGGSGTLGGGLGLVLSNEGFGAVDALPAMLLWLLVLVLLWLLAVLFANDISEGWACNSGMVGKVGIWVLGLGVLFKDSLLVLLRLFGELGSEFGDFRSNVVYPGFSRLLLLVLPLPPTGFE